MDMNDNFYALKLLGEMRVEEMRKDADKYRMIRKAGGVPGPSMMSRVGMLLINVGEGLQARSGVVETPLPQRAGPRIAGAR